ncbi:hypothetical protein ACZ90_29570 [Streptomyces albus subsp. albus]|nr:hypothetical protein ACZ90_29570 [Streptomyces albus subsp. albus]
MEIKAQWRPAEPVAGELVYTRSEYGFSFIASNRDEMLSHQGDEGVASLSFDTLQIEVSVETGRALFAWGYEPHTGWRDGRVPGPASRPGLVLLTPSEPFVPGVSVSIPGAERWDRRFDPATGWFAASAPEGAEPEWYVEIATGVVLGGSGQGIHSILLKPRFEDD